VILPKPRLIVMLLIFSMLWLLPYFAAFTLTPIVLLEILLILCIMAEIIFLFLHGKFSVETVPLVYFSLGHQGNISLKVRFDKKNRFGFTARLFWPADWEEISVTSRILPDKQLTDVMTFSYKPLRRGEYNIPRVYFRITGYLGLLFRQTEKKISLTVRVVPDLKLLGQVIQLAKQNRLASLGIRNSRRYGQGMEWDHLREYTLDDDSRNIDWKVSTRISMPVVKTYQQDTTGQLCIVLDCGRLMTAEQDGLSSLDRAVNSAQILAWNALRTQDHVSLLGFSSGPLIIQPPLRGKQAMPAINRFLSRLNTKMTDSDYNQAFDYCFSNLKKRSFIIMVTDIMGDMHYELFKKRFLSLQKKHVCLFVLLRDGKLDEAVKKDLQDTDDLFASAAARELWMERRETVRKLNAQGIATIDVLPQELTARLVSKYSELKSRHQLL
jgi:uncharacterized protein (DUF58 family)